MTTDETPPSPDALRRAFGIEVVELRRHPFGFDSTSWVADDRWFVKVWPGRPPSTLPVLDVLDLPVPKPLRTVDGSLTASVDGHELAVFPFVRGRHSTRDDWALVARTLRRVHEHPLVDLPVAPIHEPCVAAIRERLEHPWIRDRRDEVARNVDRLEAVIAAANATPVRDVVCHRDFGGWNLLIDEEDDGAVAAILDWDSAVLGPREHDVWIAFEEADPVAFLREYGARNLDPTHMEYALLARAVRDLTARVVQERDREGIEPWGFARWRRLDDDLAQLRSVS